jgi:hypothetical protein
MVLPAAAGLDRLLLIFYSIKRVSLVLSADGNAIIFGHFDRPASHFWFLDFYVLGVEPK